MIDTSPPTRHFLNVPYAEREQAKSAGARWDRAANRWYCPSAEPHASLSRWEPQSEPPQTPLPAPAERAFALYVPFEERDSVKARGAIYDPELKVWFAPKGEPAVALSHWRVTAPVFVGSGDPLEAFAMALLEAGIDEPAPVMDGVMRRAALVGGRPNKQDGVYVGYLDSKPSGYILNHKTKHEIRWTMPGPGAGPHSASTKAQSAAYRAQIQLESIERAAERQRLREAVADACEKKWQRLSSNAGNAYLERKAVSGHGVKYDGSDLIVPLRDVDGKIWSLQTIKAAEGAPKLFEKNGRKTGCFHVIGTLRDGRDFLIAEGYATAASLFEATRMPVVVAFDAGNLMAVSQSLSKKYPRSYFMVMGDDDCHGPEGTVNTGALKAQEAAQATRAGCSLPTFSSLIDRPTDFNDLARLEGASRVFEQVRNALSEQKKKARSAFSETLGERYPGAVIYHAGVWKDSRQSGKVCELAPGLAAIVSGPATGTQYVSIHDASAFEEPVADGQRVTIVYKNKSVACSTIQRGGPAIELGV